VIQPTHRNRELRDALASYTARAATLLHEIEADKRVFEIPFTVWEKQGDTLFRAVQRARPYWSVAPHLHGPQLVDLEEYKACVSILFTNPVTKRQMDTLVGSRLGMVRLEMRTVINAPLVGIANELERFAFDESLFEREYRKLEQSLYEDLVKFERVTPLFGFTSQRDHLQLTPEVALSRLEDDDIIDLLNVGLSLGTQIPGMDLITNPARFAIRIRFKLLKLTGDVTLEPSIDDIPYIRGETEEQVLRVLRVFKPGQFRPVGTVMRALNITSGVSQWTTSAPPPFGLSGYQLTLTEADEFASFWLSASHRTVLERPPLETAIRRLSYASERTNDEDKVIDLLICAEALLLSEQDDWHGEITYRLSHRAALFLETDPARRRIVFDFFRQAYDVRSKIVHGTKHPRLPLREGTTRYAFPEFIAALENYVRLAIKKAIVLSRRKGPRDSLLDWKALMFDPPPAAT
jgi:hypothetical protein